MIFYFFLFLASHFLIFSTTFQKHTVLLAWTCVKEFVLPWSVLAVISFFMTFHFSLLLFYFLCFQSPLYALLDFLLCLAFFLSNKIYLLFQFFLPLPFLLFVFCFFLPVIIVIYLVFLSPYYISLLFLDFLCITLFLLLLCLDPILLQYHL